MPFLPNICTSTAVHNSDAPLCDSNGSVNTGKQPYQGVDQPGLRFGRRWHPLKIDSSPPLLLYLKVVGLRQWCLVAFFIRRIVVLPLSTLPLGPRGERTLVAPFGRYPFSWRIFSGNRRTGPVASCPTWSGRQYCSFWGPRDILVATFCFLRASSWA